MLKRLLARLDLYKVLIFGCAVALPVLGWWIYSLQGRIAKGRSALNAATRQGRTRAEGELEAIGLYIKQIENLLKSGRPNEDIAEGHRVYFQKQITNTGVDIRLDDFSIGEIETVPVAREKAIDQQVVVRFTRDGRDNTPLTRDFLNAVLFNCESQGPWKLRQLKLRNKEVKDFVSAAKVPPPETGDEWILERMMFARRIPDPKAAK